MWSTIIHLGVVHYGIDEMKDGKAELYSVHLYQDNEIPLTEYFRPLLPACPIPLTPSSGSSQPASQPASHERCPPPRVIRSSQNLLLPPAVLAAQANKVQKRCGCHSCKTVRRK